MKKRCLVLLAEGFEEIEALTPVDLLRRAGCVVETISITESKTVTGSHGIAVTADLTAGQVSEHAHFDLILLPGGMPGSKNLDESPLVDRLLISAIKQDAVISAICAAPFVLGKRGLLSGKRATCYPGFEGELRGATLLDVGVAIDDKIITASAMGEAEDFALALVTALCGADVAERVRASIHPRPFAVDGEVAETVAQPLTKNEQILDQVGAATATLGKKLLETLKDFKAPCELVNVQEGATVLRFELQPDKHVPAKRLASLYDDIALTLGVRSVRMLVPVPGKAVVGIEIPNPTPHVVALEALLASEAFTAHKGKLPVVIGEDVAGTPVVEDLANMPHLLVAGATGSGKSICLHSMLVSLMKACTSDEVRLILIDPKKLEFESYNGLPHLLVPVVTETRRAVGALRWAVSEMERRLDMFSALAKELGRGVRNLADYNRLAKEMGRETMPQLVILIDELADLMLIASADVESSIQRLTQLARATGMHVVLGTQRPSVDVITGVIKSNIPSRIAFSVASNIDSRTILDQSGAEKLIGKGDMLYFPCGAQGPVRVQGAFVSEEEVAQVADFIKAHSGTAQYDERVMERIDQETAQCGSGSGDKSERKDGGSDDACVEDAKFLEVLAYAVKAGKLSVSLIQRQFCLGFNRAARIIDRMTELGFLSPADGAKPREVRLDAQGLAAFIASQTED